MEISSALPDDNPVYILKKVMEDLHFSGLLACYTGKQFGEMSRGK